MTNLIPRTHAGFRRVGLTRVALTFALTFVAVRLDAQPLMTPAARLVPNDTILHRLIDGLVDSTLVSEHIPGAAIAIVRDGAVVFKNGYGLANVEERRPVDVDRTIFRIGSTTKLLTALAIMQSRDSAIRCVFRTSSTIPADSTR